MASFNRKRVVIAADTLRLLDERGKLVHVYARAADTEMCAYLLRMVEDGHYEGIEASEADSEAQPVAWFQPHV